MPLHIREYTESLTTDHAGKFAGMRPHVSAVNQLGVGELRCATARATPALRKVRHAGVHNAKEEKS